MSEPRSLDAAWRLANPVPGIRSGGGKQERGVVLIVGGSRFVPAALRLTFEAVLRVGAGKAQVATIASVALPLGMTMPEASVVALAEDEAGQIAAAAAEALDPFAQRCDALIFGCGTAPRPQTVGLVRHLLAQVRPDGIVLLDAGAMVALKEDATLIRASGKRVILTPHHGELALLTGIAKDRIDADPAAAAARAAADLGALVVLKDGVTVIAAPGADVLHFINEGEGLGTAGSGDVLAGIIGGLAARIGDPRAACAWGVWLHARAGQAAARRIGPIGYLARDLLPELPAILREIPEA